MSRVPDFDVDFAARLERRAAGPGVAAQIARRIGTWDVRALLNQVRVPTLVLHMNLPSVSSEPSQTLASVLPDATYVETQPTSNWRGDGTFDTVVDFILGSDWGGGDRGFAALVFTDIVGSTERLRALGDSRWRQILDALDDVVADRSHRNGGRVVKHTGDGHLLEFPGPAGAVDAAVAIRDAASGLELDLRTGVHVGEIERRESGDIGGLPVHVAARIMALAPAGEILVSRPVADLVHGGGIAFHERGEHQLKGVDGTWQLYQLRKTG